MHVLIFLIFTIIRDMSVTSLEDISTCPSMMIDVANTNKETKIIYPPSITGKWVSSRCETRPGPIFTLRSYKFASNGEYNFLQFHYKDESCAHASYTTNTKGKYELKNCRDGGLCEYYHSITKVSLVAHDVKMVDDLWNELNDICEQIIKEHWKPHKEYMIYINDKINKSYDHFNNDGYDYKIQSPLDSKCLSHLNISLNELDFMRVQQKRIWRKGRVTQIQNELLLAKINKQNWRSHIVFQLPLISTENMGDCGICNLVARSTITHFPPVYVQPMLPLSYLSGQWISGVCEYYDIAGSYRPPYVMRNLRVNSENRIWQMEYRFYSNYNCSNLVMMHVSIGTYSKMVKSTSVSGATTVDFKMEKSSLMIMDELILDAIQKDMMCGRPFYWKMGLMVEIPSSDGCPSIGLSTSATKSDILRLEMDVDGIPLLFMGEEDKGDSTSYQYPLLQCTSIPSTFTQYPLFVTDTFNSTRSNNINFILFTLLFLFLSYFQINLFCYLF